MFQVFVFNYLLGKLTLINVPKQIRQVHVQSEHELA